MPNKQHERGIAIGDFWRGFCRSAGLSENHPFQAWHFGDCPEMADELAALVIDGPKRATAGLVADYEADGDRTLAWWRDAHWEFFSRQCAARGEVMDEAQPVVLERFELVYTDRDAGRGDNG